MYTTGLRRPGHKGRSTTQLTQLRRSLRRSPGAVRPLRPARLVGRWAVDEAGRLGLHWSLTRSESTHGPTGIEEAMPDSDDSRSTARARVDLVA